MRLPLESWSNTLRRLGVRILVGGGRKCASPPKTSPLAFETLEERTVLTGNSPWYNAASPGDVTGDLFVDCRDVYAVVSALHGSPAYSATIAPADPLPGGNRPDVNNDFTMNLADFNAVLAIFNDPSSSTTNWWSGTGGGTAGGGGGMPNSPPLAAYDLFSTRHDVSLASANVLANDTDPNNDPLTAVLESGPAHAASFSLAANGVVSYIPQAHWAGNDSFTYHANDGQANSNTATVTISVTNTVPWAFADNFTGVQDQALAPQTSVLANDNDFEGDSLTAVLATGPTHAASFALAANGTFSYMPQAGWSGSDSFTYTAFDGVSSSLPGTVQISVQASGGGSGTGPKINIGNVTLDESAGTFSFPVTLSFPSSQIVQVSYSTQNGTTNAGTSFDVIPVQGIITFNPGEVLKTINVTINEDTIDEENEVFYENLSSPVGASIDNGQGQGTILDNDDAPEIGVVGATRLESAGTLPFIITLSAASERVITVNWNTAHFSTTAGDYTNSSGTIDFPPLTVSKTILVTIANDSLDENDEQFTGNLSNPTNATLGTSLAFATITDDDSLVAPANQTSKEGATVSLQLAGNTPGYVTAGGSYYAAGLPLGLSINEMTGEITGKIAYNAFEAQTGGAYNVTVDRKDGIGQTLSSVNLTWTVSNSSIVALTGRELVSGIGTNNYLAVTGVTTDTLYYSPGNTIRLIPATDASLPPNRADVLYTITGLTGGNLISNVEFNPGGLTRTVLAGIDINLNGIMDPGEGTHSFVVAPISLTSALIAAQRTVGLAAESQHFEILQNEHFEVGGTFEFVISPTAGAAFGEDALLRYELKKVGGANTDYGAGLTFTREMTADDEGQRYVRVYNDANNNHARDNSESYLDSALFYVVQLRVFNINVEVSNKIPGAAAFAAAGSMDKLFENAAVMLLRKDSATDYRAAVTFNVVGNAGVVFTATPAGGARSDPVVNTDEEMDKHFHAAADVVFVQQMSDAAGKTDDFDWHQIIIAYNQNSNGNLLSLTKTIAHEMGHGVTLDHINPEDADRVMTELWTGSQDHLTRSEAKKFDLGD